MVALSLRVDPEPYCRNDFSKNRRGDVLFRLPKEARDIRITGHKKPGSSEVAPKAVLLHAHHLVALPLLEVLSPLGTQDPEAAPGERRIAGLEAPWGSDGGHRVVGRVEHELAQIGGLEDDAVRGIHLGNALHKEGAEAREEVSGHEDSGAARGILRPRNSPQIIDEPWKRIPELLESPSRFGERAPDVPQHRDAIRAPDDPQGLLRLHQEIGETQGGREAFREPGKAESAIVVVLFGKKHEQIPEILPGDEALQISRIGVDHASRPASQHGEARDLALLSPLGHLQDLADADRKRQALPPRGVAEPGLYLQPPHPNS